MDEFRLTIRLGNSAMQTSGDVVRKLREIADRIDATGELGNKAVSVMDENGNRVGQYKAYETGELATPNR